MGIEKEITDCKKKVRYPNQEVAERAAKRQMKMDFNRSPLRSYECEWCRGFHLTSK